MTLARPVLPPVPLGRSRWGILLGVAVVAAVVGYLAFSGISNALVYYLTPSELLARGDAAIGQYVRLGGLVQEGTLTCPSGGRVDFVMTDGTAQIPVRSSQGSAPVMCPREGVGVVVQGQLNGIGVFEPGEVIVKHDENYVAPTGGALPSQVIDPGT